MPSLNDLGKFKSSFNNIANEKDDLLKRKLPFDDLKLPTTEAPPFDFPRRASSPAESGYDSDSSDDFDINAFLNDIPLDESPMPLDTPAGGALSVLDDFLKDINPGSDEEQVETDFMSAGSFDASDESFDTDTESFAEDADFGLDAPTAENFDANDESFDESAGFDLGDSAEPAAEDFSLDDFGGAAFDDTEPESTAFGGDELDNTNFDLGDSGAFSSDEQNLEAESTAEDFSLDDFGSADFGGAEYESTAFAGADFDAGVSEEEPTDDFGIDLGGESPFIAPGASVEQDDLSFHKDFAGGDFEDDSSSMAAEDFPLDAGSDDDGIDLGGESLDAINNEPDDDSVISDFDSPLPEPDFSGMDSQGTDEGLGSLPEFGDLGADFESASIELDSEEPEGKNVEVFNETFSNDDFHLPGLDDLFDKTKPDTIQIPQPKKGFFGRKKIKTEDLPDAEDSIEEIALGQEDVDRLLRTLSSYPLNLRIICQELIAEQVILPQQLSKLIRLLVNGAHVKETAALVEEITGKPVVIPKSFEKMTGAAFEAEQSSFAYIFIHNFLPVLRLFAVIAVIAASVFYLGYRFIYLPVRAEGLYKRGYERIAAGEYQRANELFNQAFTVHRKKGWFYSYAEAFIDQRRFTLAEEKYDMLLRFYPRDKKGVLDYASLNTYYLMNFEKANRLLQRELLDYSPNDVDGLLAAGDNFLTWADSNPARFYDRYEDARFSYARLLELRGWQPSIVERMLMYFIRTDNLREVIYLRNWFESNSKRRMSTATLAELGGYLLDKQLERPTGVPNPYVENIESVRAMLLQAIFEEPTLPEPHYHLARYHNSLGNSHEERLTLENAIRAFDMAKTESVRRRLSRVDTHFRYANLLVNSREFFPAEEQAVKGIQLFEDFRNRNLISNSPQLGQLYSLLGDLEFFVKTGDMQAALRNYHTAERLGYSQPETQYRMGTAYYQLEDWRNALEYLFRASAELPLNRRLLFALGNAAFQRGDFFAAQGYYSRLLDLLEVQRIRLPVLLPNDSTQFMETGERLMMARNNLGVVYEAIADQTGNREFRNRAMAMYAESARAWDAITRNPLERDPVTREPNPDFMSRMRLTDSPGAPGINLGYLNANNALRPNTGYRPQIFVRIDRDVLEPSRWEELLR